MHAYSPGVPGYVCRHTTRAGVCVITTPPVGRKHVRLVHCFGRRDVSFRCRQCNDVSRIPPCRWLVLGSPCSIALLSVLGMDQGGKGERGMCRISFVDSGGSCLYELGVGGLMAGALFCPNVTSGSLFVCVCPVSGGEGGELV